MASIPSAACSVVGLPSPACRPGARRCPPARRAGHDTGSSRALPRPWAAELGNSPGTLVAVRLPQFPPGPPVPRRAPCRRPSRRAGRRPGSPGRPAVQTGRPPAGQPVPPAVQTGGVPAGPPGAGGTGELARHIGGGPVPPVPSRAPSSAGGRPAAGRPGGRRCHASSPGRRCRAGPGTRCPVRRAPGGRMSPDPGPAAGPGNPGTAPASMVERTWATRSATPSGSSAI
jgi:hypothetical protein